MSQTIDNFQSNVERALKQETFRIRNGHFDTLRKVLDLEEDFTPDVFISRFIELYYEWFLSKGKDKLEYASRNVWLKDLIPNQYMAKLSGTVRVIEASIRSRLGIRYIPVARELNSPESTLTKDQLINGLNILLGVDITLEQ